MNKPIQIEICTGTTCFVMGAGHLLNLAEELPERLRSKVDIRGSHCLGYCRDASQGKPPFAKVGGQLVTNATMENILQACDQQLAGTRGDG